MRRNSPLSTLLMNILMNVVGFPEADTTSHTWCFFGMHQDTDHFSFFRVGEQKNMESSPRTGSGVPHAFKFNHIAKMYRIS